VTARSRCVAPVGICVLCTAVAACGHEPAARGGRACEAVFPAPYERVDACSAVPVMTAGVRAMFSYRPADQGSPQAAFQAAEPLMDNAFATHAAPAAVVLAPVTAAMWQQWAQRGVSVTAVVQATADDHPPDTATSAARVLAVTEQPGDASPPIAFTVYARAGRTDPATGWRITGLEVMT